MAKQVGWWWWSVATFWGWPEDYKFARLPETCNVAGLSLLSVAASSLWRSVRARPWKSTSRCAPGGERPHRLPWLQLFHGLNSIGSEMVFRAGPQWPLPQEQVEALKSGRKKAEKARSSWKRWHRFFGRALTMHLPVLILASEMIRCWYLISSIYTISYIFFSWKCFFLAKFYRSASFEPRSQAWWLHWKVIFWRWCHRLWKPFGSHDLQPLDVSWLEMEKTCHGGTKQRDVFIAGHQGTFACDLQ